MEVCSQSDSTARGLFPTAFVFFRQRGSASSSCSTRSYIAISTAIWWKPVLPRDRPPTSFSDFRNENHCPLERLPPDTEWKDVEDFVTTDCLRSGYAVVIMLKKRPRMMRAKVSMELVLVAETEDERDAWLNAIRLRLSPWQLLESSARELKSTLPATITFDALAENIRRMTMQSSVDDGAAHVRVSNYANECNRNLADDACNGEAMNKCATVADAFRVVPDFVLTVATITKTFFKESFVGKANEGAQIASDIADVAKCVSVVSSFFQLVAFSLRLAAMGGEASRGRKLMSGFWRKAQNLLSLISDSAIRTFHPHVHLHQELLSGVFQVQQKSMDVMIGIEDYMMQSRVSQFFNSSDVKKLEKAIDELADKVYMIVTVGELAKMKSEASRDLVPSFYERPNVTPYFTGRKEELSTLKNILDQHNSAAIVQYGGAGKTQLMTAFAEKAEKNSWIPGGTYWVQAHGDKNQFLSSLARFAGSLLGVRLDSEEKKDLDLVLSLLKRKLRSNKKKWLLCIDNADHPSTSTAIGELCGISLLGTKKGWILVTSRQGCQTLWPGMICRQRMVLNPFDVSQAMITLFRYKGELLATDVSDDQVKDRLRKLRATEPKEFGALKELAGNNKSCGLDGLSLALAQAGRFIHHRKISFAEYVELFKRKRKTENVSSMFFPVDDAGLKNDDQRTIWMTWKMNLDSLSQIARYVVAAFALFDSKPVPEQIVKRLEPQFLTDKVKYLQVIRGELVEGTSFLEEKETDEGEVMYQMHSLIREFIIWAVLSLKSIRQNFGNCEEQVFFG